MITLVTRGLNKKIDFFSYDVIGNIIDQNYVQGIMSHDSCDNTWPILSYSQPKTE